MLHLLRCCAADSCEAHSFQDDGKFAEAAALWASVVDEAGPPTQKGLILYNLGVCYRELDQPGEAVKAWEQCLNGAGDADESAASALALADLALQDNSIDKALALYARVVAKIPAPEAWQNSLVSRKRDCISGKGRQTVAADGTFRGSLEGDGRFEPIERARRGDAGVWPNLERMGGGGQGVTERQ